MGMMPTIVQSWHEASEAAMHHQTIASRRAAIVSADSKWARMVIQIEIMTAAAWQMLQPGSTMSQGVMMAEVIRVGLSLMPLDDTIVSYHNTLRHCSKIRREELRDK